MDHADAEPSAAPPILPAAAADPIPEDETESSLNLVAPLIRELAAQREMRPTSLRQLTHALLDNSLWLQNQIYQHKHLTEIHRRVQILQDWMMSPFRLIPMQVLQGNTLNIDKLINYNKLFLKFPVMMILVLFHCLNSQTKAFRVVFHILIFHGGNFYIQSSLLSLLTYDQKTIFLLQILVRRPQKMMDL